MAKLSIRDLNLQGKTVFMRVDFNVPLANGGQEITSDKRIKASLPSIQYALAQGAALILASHLGRPKGKRNPEMSLRPVAARLAELLGQPVAFAPDCVGPEVEAMKPAPGAVLLLENLRYHAAEEENDPAFARQLAGLCDLYVNDAFGTAHRAHASTAGVTGHLSPCAMGFLVEKELEYLVDKLEEPARPFVVIMGGAKVSDKIEVLNRLMGKADAFIIGGAMANTFRLAQGYQIGKSLAEPDKTDLALQILDKAAKSGIEFLLPADTRHTAEFRDDAPTECTAVWGEGGAIPDDREGIDIGDKAIEEFSKKIAEAGTLIWNGPMGVFEKRGFDIGTRAIGKAIADNKKAVKIVGGGDSVTAANQFGFGDQMDHMSTGGGASLELLEGKELPGIAALDDK